MTADRTFRFIVRRWFVRVEGTINDDLTKALRTAMGKRAIGTQRKAAAFANRFLSFEVNPGEPMMARFTESDEALRARLEAFLISLGLDIDDNDRADGSFYVNQGTAGSVGGGQVGLALLGRFYQQLVRRGYRASNPFKVAGYQHWTPSERRDMAEAVHGHGSFQAQKYRGQQYILTANSKPAIRMEDPAGLAPKVLDAGAAYGWPDSIYDLTSMMGEDGSRWSDVSALTAADWARKSNFGRSFSSPNKGSRGKRAKTVIVSAKASSRLCQSFDRGSKRPSMAQLRQWKAEERWDLLEKTFLFPSRTGRPYTYHVFNNDYFRPAIEKAGVLIHSDQGSVRPTPHRLRSGRIQQSADQIYRGDKTEHQIKVEEGQLKRDVFIKSDDAFERYLGPLRQDRAEKGKLRRFDERMRALGHSTDSGASTSLGAKLRDAR